VVESRTITSLTMRTETGRRVTSCSIGPIHYERDGEMHEIDTRFRDGRSGFSDAVDDAPYHAEIRNDGTRRYWPRAEVENEWIEWGQIEEQRGGRWRPFSTVRSGRNDNLLTFGTQRRELRVRATPTGLKVDLVLERSTEAGQYRFPFTLNNLTVEDGVLFSVAERRPIGRIRPITVYDAEGEAHDIDWAFTENAVEVTGDLSGLTFPVTIDPTVDSFQVGAGADDGHALHETETLSTSGNVFFGYGFEEISAFWRFTDVTVPNGVDILSAHVEHTANGSSSFSFTTDISAQASDDAVSPTTYTAFTSASRTTQNVNWSPPNFTGDESYNTPDISDVVAEVVARAGWESGNALLIYHDTPEGTDDAVRQVYGYDQSASDASVFHVEWQEPVTIPDTPLNPTATDIAATSATVSADTVADADTYTLRWREKLS
jgi:hypothetical protein